MLLGRAGAEHDLVTATDNCGGAVTVTFVSDVATNGTSSCNNVITRTYVATDAVRQHRDAARSSSR